jgi:uncharacterized protein
MGVSPNSTGRARRLEMKKMNWLTAFVFFACPPLALLSVSTAMGQSGPQSQADDISALRRAAEQGDAQSQYELGYRYYSGKGVAKDPEKAARWWRDAAEQGSVSAQRFLGLMYDQGKDVPQDYKEAVRWYRLAADQGDAPAQGLLGSLYMLGQGVPQDYKEALHWYRLAANQENAYAQFYLGFMYDHGYGLPVNYTRAHMWYNLACASGDADVSPQAVKNRDIVASKMTPQQIAEAQRLARKWKPTEPK